MPNGLDSHELSTWLPWVPRTPGQMLFTAAARSMAFVLCFHKLHRGSPPSLALGMR